ncbi:ESX secretion-associated protein EspG [Prauserella flavalba]|nr:ESX secretion-associated protein EspG [Prauserella flavalba]
MFWTGPAELPLHTLLTAMTWAGCGEPHAIFSGGVRYVPPAAARQVDREAFERLTEQGLTVGKALDPDFEDVLHVLDRPHTEYFAHIRSGDTQYGVLVAIRGRSAVLARHRDRTVHLRSLGDRDYPTVLAGQLPRYRPAPVETFSLPKGDLDGLARLLDNPRGMGFLHVARRAGGGERVEAPAPVGYLDSDTGRLGFTHAEGGGHLTVFAGEPGQLAARLTAVRATLS